MEALILEDNMFNNYYATREMKKLGYRVHSVYNSADAIKMSQDIPFSIILIDGNISTRPLFINTQNTIKRLRYNSNSETLLLLMVSGNLGNMPSELLKHGVSGFVPKPITAEAVLSELIKAGCICQPEQLPQQGHGGEKHANPSTTLASRHIKPGTMPFKK
ncbi:response regulator [Desulfovibrio sp. DV]|uniref:response regulator n=1 Tax=Desulfovibrio sp. DV TaxID=1844708 RepID=UPI0009FA84EA|nr:response regulator [Desulfovibrio sp. DV]